MARMSDAQFEDALAKAARLQKELDTRSATLNELKALLLPEIQRRGKQTVAQLTFFTATRKTWDYPQSVQVLEVEFKNAQKLSKANGTASVKSETPYVTIKSASRKSR